MYYYLLGESVRPRKCYSEGVGEDLRNLDFQQGLEREEAAHRKSLVHVNRSEEEVDGLLLCFHVLS
jgi:hypothetical protein